MSNIVEILSKVDAATLQFEQARRALEKAKANFEASKQAFDEALAQADAMGFSKSKMKRMAEERLSALIETGLVDFGPTAQEAKRPAAESAPEKSPKNKKKAKPEAAAKASGAASTDDSEKEVRTVITFASADRTHDEEIEADELDMSSNGAQMDL